MTSWGASANFMRNYDFTGVPQDQDVGGVANFLARNIRVNFEGSRGSRTV